MMEVDQASFISLKYSMYIYLYTYAPSNIVNLVGIIMYHPIRPHPFLPILFYGSENTHSAYILFKYTRNYVYYDFIFSVVSQAVSGYVALGRKGCGNIIAFPTYKCYIKRTFVLSFLSSFSTVFQIPISLSTIFVCTPLLAWCTVFVHVWEKGVSFFLRRIHRHFWLFPKKTSTLRIKVWLTFLSSEHMKREAGS